MADQLANQLAKFLKNQRGDLTFRLFAKKLGISSSTLQRMEIAQQNVTISTLEQICKRLKVGINDIFE